MGAAIALADGVPTIGGVEANAHVLVRYAALCQEADIVPIAEPEVLMNGNHSLERSYEITEHALKALFYQLYRYRVDL